MTTRTVSSKIPHRLNVTPQSMESTIRQMYKDRANKIRRAAGQDAVAPSVKGRQAVKPSSIGIAAQNRFVEAATRTVDAADAMLRLIAARDAADPALRALAEHCLGNPEFLAALNEQINSLNSMVQEMSGGESGARGNRDALENEQGSARFENAPSEGDPNAAGGLIGDAATLGHPLTFEETIVMDRESRLQMGRARERAAKVRAQLQMEKAFGDPGDIVRAQFGIESRMISDDEIYAAYEGKRK